MQNGLDREFRTLLSEIYREVMKPQGWKRDAQNFRLIRQDGIITKGVIVNFQKSQWNSDEELHFTINSARKMVIGVEIDPKFKVYDCHFSDQHRPQSLCKKYTRDQWWSITAETEYDALKAEITEFLNGYALPQLMGQAGAQER